MQIGVIGSWEDNLHKGIYEIAEEVGRLIARRGDILLTGGSMGIMEAAVRGAKSEKGLTVGIIPTEKKEEYLYLNRVTDIFIMTGMGEYGRLAPLIHSVEGVIAIAGGAGTLIEISMAYLQDKPVVAIPFQGYTTDRIRGMLQDMFLDHRRVRPLYFAESASRAVDILYSNLSGSR